MPNFYLQPKSSKNALYAGYYNPEGIRAVARDIKTFGEDLPLDLMLGTAAKESTLGNSKRLPDHDPEYRRWYASPRSMTERVQAIKHPKYLNALNAALDRQIAQKGPDAFLYPRVYRPGVGMVNGTNTEIRDRNISDALAYDPELKKNVLSARFASMKLREGMQKFKGNKNKAARWYNWNEPDRGERVMDLGRTALEHPAVRQILTEEGLLK